MFLKLKPWLIVRPIQSLANIVANMSLHAVADALDFMQPLFASRFFVANRPVTRDVKHCLGGRKVESRKHRLMHLELRAKIIRVSQNQRA